MISSLLFSLSATCLVVANFLPQRASGPRQQLETYYVCGPESSPNSDQDVASPAFAGAACD